MNQILHTSSRHDYLSVSQLLAGLNDREMRKVDGLTTTVRCERGAFVFSPEDSPGTVYLLREGVVRLYRRTAGGEQTVARLEPGTVFGDCSLIGQLQAGVYADVVEAGLVQVLPASCLRTLILLCPRIGLNLLEHVGQRLTRTQRVAQDAALSTSRQGRAA